MASEISEMLRRARSYPYAFPHENVTYENGITRPFDFSETQGRIPVLGCGSNQSPARLAQKFGHLESCLIPVERVKLHGFDSVFSAHVTGYGAVAATLQVSEGSIVEVAITWLDPSQLEIMHETELRSGNYHYGTFQDIKLVRASGEIWSEATAYFSTRGCLRNKDGASIAITAIPCDRRSFEHMTTEAALDVVCQRVAPDMDSEAFILSCIQDETFRQNINEKLAKHANPFGYPYSVIASQ